MKKPKNQKDGQIVKTMRITAMFLEMQISALGGWRIIFRYLKFKEKVAKFQSPSTPTKEKWDKVWQSL